MRRCDACTHLEVMTGLACEFSVELLTYDSELPEPPATIDLSHYTETSPCHLS